MRHLRRLRVEVRSGPGALARLGRAIESLGGTMVTVDLQDMQHQPKAGVVDTVVALPSQAVGPDVIESAIEFADGGRLTLWEPAQEAVDPVLRSIRWACSIISAGADAIDDEATRVVGEICGTEDAWFLTLDRASLLTAGRAALEQGAPVTEQLEAVPADLECSFCGATAILAVPDARLDASAIAVVLRPAEQQFSTSEIERVEAILGLRRQAMNILPRSPIRLDATSWADLFDG